MEATAWRQARQRRWELAREHRNDDARSGIHQGLYRGTAGARARSASCRGGSGAVWGPCERTGVALRPRDTAPSDGRRIAAAQSCGCRPSPESWRTRKRCVRNEIDRLRWPVECTMLAENQAWHGLLDQLSKQISMGQKCIAVTSLERGVGRTTVCLTLARQLAARGLRPLIVDADCQQPDLARVCRLQQYSGWGEVMLGDMPLEEALVAAIDDGVTLMPWRGAEKRLSQLATSERVATSFELLRGHYDLVLIDAPPVSSDEALGELVGFAEGISLDAVYLLYDARYPMNPGLGPVCDKLRSAGLAVEGLMENFGAADSDPSAPGAAAVNPPATHH